MIQRMQMHEDHSNLTNIFSRKRKVKSECIFESLSLLLIHFLVFLIGTEILIGIFLGELMEKGAEVLQRGQGGVGQLVVQDALIRVEPLFDGKTLR